jgi:divalent metal cation (Fe/Co/Zn/Cd) transporter
MNRYFWSFVVGLILFSLGGLFAIYEGIHKIEHPEELKSPVVAVGILVIAIVLEGYSLHTAIAESKPLKGTQSWWSFIRHSRVPELPVLLLEDSAAETGLVLALGGVVLSLVTDNPIWDGIGTLSIGIVLLIVAIVLCVEMRSLLLGEGATRHDVELIRRAVNASPHVRRLIHMRTMHLGPEDLLVAAKIELEGVADAPGVCTAIDETEDLIRAAVPLAKIIYLEPAVFDPMRTADPVRN